MKSFPKGFALSVALLWLFSCTTLEDRIKQAAKVEKAREDLRGKDYLKALNQFEKTLEKQPENAKALEGAIVALIRLGRYYEALTYTERREKLKPSCSLCDFYKGETYRALGKCSHAVISYKKALKKRPRNKQILRSLAWALYMEGEYEEGVRYIDKVYKGSSFDLDTAVIRARFLLEMKDFKGVLSTCNRALTKVKRADEKAQFYSFKGDVSLAYLQWSEAKTFYQKALVLDPLLGGALFGLGKYYYLKHEKEDAKKYLTRALRVSEKFVEAYYYLAKLYEKEDREKSRVLYQKFYRGARKEKSYFGELVPEVRKKLKKFQST